MKTISVSTLELAMIGATRAAIGAGVALLLVDRIKTVEQRKAVAFTLIGIGAVTTLPILAKILFSGSCDQSSMPAGRLSSEEYAS